MSAIETIVAPVTPPGEGGVGIIRLSGPQALSYLATTFHGKVSVESMQTHRLYYGYLCHRDGTRLDEVLAVAMFAPHSYTGEDVVEVHCHGGSQIMRSVLDLFLDEGARIASPGEFTQRAFLNGRLDLAQAEAVIDVIRARSERAGQVALSQLDGQLSRRIYSFSAQLKEALALLEAHIDFPDDEVGSLDLPTLLTPVRTLVVEMSILADSFNVGRVLQEGLSVLILGRPNVGKSSLMNALLGESRAIVTDVAGTTRDTLEESLVLGGFPVRLVDAAGVRDTDDPVEKQGVQRARDKAAVADVILLVLDGSTPLTEEDRLALNLAEVEKTVVVINKNDQQQGLDLTLMHDYPCCVSVSAKHAIGLDRLRDAVVERLNRDGLAASGEGVVVTERRHRDALLQAVAALRTLFVSADDGEPLECLAMDMREALSALGQITGETTPDEILDQIFSRFCIGK